MPPVTPSRVERRRVKFIRCTDLCRAIRELAVGRRETFNINGQTLSRMAGLDGRSA